MEVLPLHHQARYIAATAAVSSILCEEEDDNPLEVSLPETSFSKARSFHKASESDTSSDDDVSTSQIKQLLPDLQKHFEVQRKVGEGTFASVYLAAVRANRTQQVAIKHVTPTCHPKRIQKEIQCLREIGGADNVCGIYTCVRNKGNIAFILPFIRHDRFQEYVLEMDANETRLYVRNLLLALRRVHQFNVIHRDVKPGNFLYDRQQKKFLLVDFGLAQTIKPPNAAPLLPPPILPPPPLDNKKSVALDCRKRKADVENALSPAKKLASASSGRPVLCAKNTKNVAPLNSLNDVKTSFVRVKNSQVKMVSAPLTDNKKCPCFKKPQLCQLCLTRTKKLVAPRAGTPGYRPPEVLLKTPNQTTAVDIWAAGIVFMCILSGSYPFFRSPDDMTALAEIVTLFGSKAISEVAIKLDRVFVCDRVCPPLDLEKVCTTLRANRLRPEPASDSKKRPLCATCAPSLTSIAGQIGCFCPAGSASVQDFPQSAFDLLKRMLDPNPTSRITADQALCHPFLAEP